MPSRGQSSSREKVVNAYLQTVEQGDRPFLSEEEYELIFEYFRSSEQLEQALQVLDFAIAQFQFQPDFLLYQAEVKLQLGRYAQAQASLKRAASLASNSVHLFVLEAAVLARLSRYEEAIHLLEEVLDNHPLKPEERLRCLLGLSELLDRQRSYEQVFLTLSEALHLQPDHPETLEKLGSFTERHKWFGQSAALLNAILCKEAYNPLAWFFLGQSYSWMGRYEDATEAFELAIAVDESFEPAHQELAGLLFDLGNYAEALEKLNNIIQSFNEDGDALFRIGLCHLHLTNFGKARFYFRRSLHFNPSDDEALFYLGETYAMEELWLQACRYYEKAIDIEGEREEYFAALGEAYYHTGAAEEANRCFRKAVEINPDETAFWIQFASFLMEENELAQALEVLDEASDYNPDGELAFCRSACLFALGHRQDALLCLSQALLEDYEKYPLLFELVPALQMDGDVNALIATMAD